MSYLNYDTRLLSVHTPINLIPRLRSVSFFSKYLVEFTSCSVAAKVIIMIMMVCQCVDINLYFEFITLISLVISG